MGTSSRKGRHLHSVAIGQMAQSYAFWIGGDKKGQMRASAQASARSSVAHFVRFVGEDRPVRDITEMDVQRYIHQRLEMVKPNTVRSEFARIRAFLEWAVERGHVDSNVASKAKAPPEDKPLLRSTSEEQFAQIVTYTYGTEAEYRNRAALYLVHDTGMRIGTCSRLRVEDVDLDQRYVVVYPEGDKRHTGRQLPFTDTCAAELFDYLTYQRGREAGPLWVNSRTGQPLGEQGLKHEMRKLAKRAGISFGAHDLRRAFVDRCLAAGMPESLIMHLTGHESQEMIRRYGRHNADATATAMYRKLMG